MTTHPEVQRKAQAEIDRVVGNDRFPTLDDQARLPYVDAVAREVLRWGLIAPLGKFSAPESHRMRPPPLFQEIDYQLPARAPTHCYRGRLLQRIFHSQGIYGNCKHLVSDGTKGRTSLSKFLFVRIRSPRFDVLDRQIAHDPGTYVDPMEFNPERFLGDNPEPEPRATVFGYGRRICECHYFLRQTNETHPTCAFVAL